MATTQAHLDGFDPGESTDETGSQTSGSKAVRHSHEDAISDDEFDRLLAVADRLESPYAAETRLLLIACGRLGLRAGELTHLDQDWINWERDRIEIPSYDPCTRGEDGTPCGYCRHQARSSYRCLDEQALARRWEPKTDAAARAVPFGWDADVQATVEAFFADRDRWPRSRATVNRRVDRLAAAAGTPAEELYPHCLRATAGSFHAYRGVGTAALMNLMGWSQLQTAQAYIRRSGSATADALQRAHGADNP